MAYPIGFGRRRIRKFSGLTYAQKVITLGPIGYWRLEEASGAVLDSSAQANNAAVVGAPTRGAAGKSGLCYTFDGSTTAIDLYSAGLAADFVGGEITLAAWVYSTANDTTTRGIMRLRADASNVITLNKGNSATNFTAAYIAGGVTKTVSTTAITFLNTWRHVAITASKTADEVKAYVDGVQIGTTQTGIGTWAGVLASGFCVIGSLTNVPANVWGGSIDEAVVFARALSGAEILQLATV